jgi:hypothetical protein
MITSYLGITFFSCELGFYDHLANLLDLIQFCLSTFWLEIQDFTFVKM